MAIMKRVLIVDDEEHARCGLGLLLHQAGFEVYSAPDALQALAELRRRQVHIVLSDVQMPGMNGWALLQEMHREHPGVGVILMTAHAGVEGYQQALRLGAYDYIHKPLVFEELMYMIQSYFQRH